MSIQIPAPVVYDGPRLKDGQPVYRSSFAWQAILGRCWPALHRAVTDAQHRDLAEFVPMEPT